MSHKIEEGLINSIIEDPSDDNRRLIYADWREDNGLLSEPLRKSGNWVLYENQQTSDIIHEILTWRTDKEVLAIKNFDFFDLWENHKQFKCVCNNTLGIIYIFGKWACSSCISNLMVRSRKEAILQMFPNNSLLCPVCSNYTKKYFGDGCCEDCNRKGAVIGRRGWGWVGDYDG